MAEGTSGRLRAYKKPEDVVHIYRGRWWFWDEHDKRMGPYDTEAAARRGLDRFTPKARVL